MYVEVRESIPRQVDKKSGAPGEEQGVQGSQGGEKDKHFFLHCFVLVQCILLKDIFLLNKNLLTNLVILKLVYCGSVSGSVQFSSVAQSCPTPCSPMDCSTPGFPVHHQLLECAQTPIHWVSDAIQPSHPLSSPSPPAFNLSQHQGLFKWVSFSYQVARVLEFQLQN